MVNYAINPLGDEASHATITLDYAHHEIHEGDHYSIRINKDTAAAGTFAVAFTTPDTLKWCHMLFEAVVEGETDVILYEGVTSWTGGSAITPVNHNRNSTKTSGITNMVFDPTMTLGSPVTLGHMVIPAGRSSGGVARGDAEYILKQNTKYYFLLSNQVAGQPNEQNIVLEWYEHTSFA